MRGPNVALPGNISIGDWQIYRIFFLLHVVAHIGFDIDRPVKDKQKFEDIHYLIQICFRFPI